MAVLTREGPAPQRPVAVRLGCAGGPGADPAAADPGRADRLPDHRVAADPAAVFLDVHDLDLGQDGRRGIRRAVEVLRGAGTGGRRLRLHPHGHPGPTLAPAGHHHAGGGRNTRPGDPDRRRRACAELSVLLGRGFRRRPARPARGDGRQPVPLGLDRVLQFAGGGRHADRSGRDRLDSGRLLPVAVRLCRPRPSCSRCWCCTPSRR